LGGRGAGKTRSLVEWARADLKPTDRLAIVARTAADLRDVLIEGESGILAVSPPWDKPVYEPTKRRLTWPNGATAHLYSSQEPDVLRGPQHSRAIADELATWENGTSVWTNLMMGLRLGDNPRWAAATTPRPVRLLKDLMADPTVIVRRSSTYDNAPNLPRSFLGQIITRYEGTSTGRSELLGEFVDEIEGALWTRALCDACLLKSAPEDLARIVVGVDPAASSGENADSTGIVVCGRDSEGRYYVLADRTVRATPKGWAEAAIKAYREFKADRIVCEKNAGGEMCEAVIRQVDPSVSLKLVHASRGKRVRAEPVAAVFEQHKAYFCGDFPDLIDELCTWTVDDPQSPDRLDAMTWVMSDLLEGRRSRIWTVGAELPASAGAGPPKPSKATRWPSAWPPPGQTVARRESPQARFL
jgi:predicted phage terminase large subunit-like protein